MGGYVVGIDGGGTRTCALLMDREGKEVGYAEGPSALVLSRDPESAALAVEGVVTAAARAGGAALPLDALWAGLAGAGREEARRQVESLLQGRGLARRVGVGTDMEAAFYDAFGSGSGVLLVAGTGSAAMGVGEDGRRIRVGGWGSVMGDEGSGYGMGIHALRSVAQSADGRAPETALTRVILGALELDDPTQLIAWSEGASKAEIAALAPHVAAVAWKGDARAREVVETALGELRRQLWAAVNGLSPWEEPAPVALVGGLISPEGPLRRGIEGIVLAVGGRLVREPVTPERGAARKAMALAEERREAVAP